MEYPVPIVGRSGLLRDLLVILVVSCVVLIDQASKLAVQQLLPIGESFPPHGLLRATHVVNSGAVFGLFPGQSFILTLGSFLGIGVLAWFYHQPPVGPGRILRLSLGLQLGGAFGNLIDRLRLGEVVDFIDFGPWYIFNIADASIVSGLFLLVSLVLTSDHWESRTLPRAPFGPYVRRGSWPEAGC
jgi:signal peptidase II